MSEKGGKKSTGDSKHTKHTTQMTMTAAARIQRSEASRNGGSVPANGFASRAQAAAAKKENGK